MPSWSHDKYKEHGSAAAPLHCLQLGKNRNETGSFEAGLRQEASP